MYTYKQPSKRRIKKLLRRRILCKLLYRGSRSSHLMGDIVHLVIIRERLAALLAKRDWRSPIVHLHIAINYHSIMPVHRKNWPNYPKK
jgi:hypothetical protein